MGSPAQFLLTLQVTEFKPEKDIYFTSELFLIFNIDSIVERFLDDRHHVLIHTVGHSTDISILY